jgi:methylated-DNA-[protein]-cysteine S-methyltransferase
MIYTCTVNTPLGNMTASAEEGALTGLWFIGQKYYPETGAWKIQPDYPPFAALRLWLKEYFARRSPPLENPLSPGGDGLRLNPRGTAFQRAVWEILLTIPYGQLSTYGKIAGQIAAARGRLFRPAQAVGGAVGHNPISILIPCHRVVGSTGSLTDYAGGIEKKKALLQLEGREL